ncbi:MAG TPA: organomercurial lyase [Sphingomicrobium sp.]|nr:organomercurial lyase [Sphingomicrobium sp.]
MHDAHSLLLHPHRCAAWVVHPFALSPGSCWVEIGARGWWANCVYCAMGIAASLKADADISTRIGGEREPVVIRIRDDDVLERDLLLHLSTPVREWWDNVIHACATFQPFRRKSDVHVWCERHAMPLGAIIPLPEMYAFARDWYGDYVDKPWRKRSRDETVALFAKHGFEGEFWKVE